MTPERIILGEGVALNVIECNKFKTNCIAIRFLCPLTEDKASLNALLPFVLKRGCRRLPSMTEMEKEFDILAAKVEEMTQYSVVDIRRLVGVQLESGMIVADYVRKQE